MNKQQRAKIVLKTLDEYFPNPEVPLFYKDIFTLLIAVILSANSTDRCVNRVTPTLFKKAGTPKKMAGLKISEIEKIIRPCGLGPSKAKAIVDLSKRLVEKHSARVPKTFEELEGLPGVGHKTASVVLSQGYNIPAFPVDTHIFRCAKRWGLSQGSTRAQVEEDLKKIFPQSKWKKTHLQIIYFARKFCPAQGHKKEICPICSKLFPII